MQALPSRTATRLPVIADSLRSSTSTSQVSRLTHFSTRPFSLQNNIRHVASYSTKSPLKLSIVDSTPPQRKRPISPTPKSSPSLPAARRKPTIFGAAAIAQRSSHSRTTSIPVQEPTIHDIFEPETGTWQYVVADPSTMTAVIIDPVLDYSPTTQTVTTTAADSLFSLTMFWGYKIDMILETHAHADHLTAASYLQSRLALQQGGHRPLIGIGKRIDQVQKWFGQRYGVPENEWKGTFDKLFDDDEGFEIGNLKAQAIHLPGHTPDHMGYYIGDNVFCGDSIFHPDLGTARCDFPGGSSLDLFHSAHKLLSLPSHIKIWTGHDYPPTTRDTPEAWMTVEEHRLRNKHLKEGTTQEEFVTMRDERDNHLGAPRLLHQSLQMNIRAGRLPGLNGAGQAMLHLPLQLGGMKW